MYICHVLNVLATIYVNNSDKVYVTSKKLSITSDEIKNFNGISELFIFIALIVQKKNWKGNKDIVIEKSSDLEREFYYPNGEAKKKRKNNFFRLVQETPRSLAHTDTHEFIRSPLTMQYIFC